MNITIPWTTHHIYYHTKNLFFIFSVLFFNCSSHAPILPSFVVCFCSFVMEGLITCYPCCYLCEMLCCGKVHALELRGKTSVSLPPTRAWAPDTAFCLERYPGPRSCTSTMYQFIYHCRVTMWLFIFLVGEYICFYISDLFFVLRAVVSLYSVPTPRCRSSRCAIVTGGCRTDVITLHKLLKIRMIQYKTNHKREMYCPSAGSLLQYCDYHN